MRTALVLVCIALIGSAPAGEAQVLDRLSVEDIGTPLDIPEIWGSVGRQYVAVSPDEQWVAYTQPGEPPDQTLFLKPVNGGAERIVYRNDQFAEQLKDDPVYNDPRYTVQGNPINSVTFTPDSKEIVFEVSFWDSTLGSTWQINYDSQGRLTGISKENPVPYIKSYTIETREIRDITFGSGWGLAWDTTGRYLFVPHNWDTWMVQAGLNPFDYYFPAILDRQTGEKWPVDRHGIFSHDSQSLLYWEQVPGTPTWQLFKTSIWGGQTEQIASKTDTNLTGIYWSLLSTDGKWLFFTKVTSIKAIFDFTRDTDPHTSGSYTAYASTICFMDMETGQIRELFPMNYNLGMAPIAISSDGKTIYLHVDDAYLSHYWIDEYGWTTNGAKAKNCFVVAVPFDPSGPATAVASAPTLFPTLVSYPNPFNASTVIAFTVPENGLTELSIYNIAGQVVRKLVEGEMTAGTYEAVWDGKDDRGVPVSSGIYISQLRAGEQAVTGRMMLVK